MSVNRRAAPPSTLGYKRVLFLADPFLDVGKKPGTQPGWTGLQVNLPAVCVQSHEVLLLKRDAEEWDLVPRLVRGPIQPLGLEQDEE